MSDVTVAPEGSAPAAAPTNEVAINQTPVNTPNPIGSQAPPAPTGDLKGSTHRPESRREAIEKAFERANNPKAQPERHAPKPAPKPAEAKPGHNKPPEETPKLDLKKRPTEQPQPRERGEHGHFAPRATDDSGQQSGNRQQQPQQQPQQPQPHKQLPANAPYSQPPQRMAEHAKAQWHATPEHVRGEVHRMQQEFTRAYQSMKADVEAFHPIRHFAKMAQEHGTTLEKALTNYTGMEHRLRSDPLAGLDVIVHNLGIMIPDGNGGTRRANLRDISYTVLSQTPDQLRMIQQGNNQQANAHQIGALHQEIAGLKNQLAQMHHNQQFTYTRSAVDQFAGSHPRFDELGDLIERELQFGFDLETAYRRADLLRPSTHAAQTRTPSAQTRPTDRSIHGSPEASLNGAQRKPREPSRSPREAVSNAISRYGGGRL